MISKNPLLPKARPLWCQCKTGRGFPGTPEAKCLTCSSSDNDAARLRDFNRPSSTLLNAAFLLVGLSGGDNSELGVVLVSPLERSSESSPYLSKMGSLRLSGESDIVKENIGLRRGEAVLILG